MSAGFIRTYARFLGLDAEEAVARFQPVRRRRASGRAVPPATADDAPEAARRSGRCSARSSRSCWSASSATSTGSTRTGAGAGARRDGGPGNRTRGAARSDAGGIAAPPAATQPGAAPALHHQLAVRLTQRSWLRVAVDGTTQLEGIFPAGTTRTFTGKAADVRAGNAGGVVATVDGRPTRPLGKDGDVAEQRYTL